MNIIHPKKQGTKSFGDGAGIDFWVFPGTATTDQILDWQDANGIFAHYGGPGQSFSRETPEPPPSQELRERFLFQRGGSLPAGLRGEAE